MACFFRVRAGFDRCLFTLSLSPIEVGGVKLAQFGQSSGVRGLPGDFTLPSRFVRAVALWQSTPTLRYCLVGPLFRPMSSGRSGVVRRHLDREIPWRLVKLLPIWGAFLAIVAVIHPSGGRGRLPAGAVLVSAFQAVCERAAIRTLAT